MKKINTMHDLLPVVVLAIATPVPVMGAENATQSTNEPAMKLSESNPRSRPTTYEGPGLQPEVGALEETATEETWGERSYWIPFFEILAFEATLNIYDRLFWDEQVFDTTFNSFQDNLTTSPVIDSDSFQINQLYHPYQGAMSWRLPPSVSPAVIFLQRPTRGGPSNHRLLAATMGFAA